MVVGLLIGGGGGGVNVSEGFFSSLEMGLVIGGSGLMVVVGWLCWVNLDMGGGCVVDGFFLIVAVGFCCSGNRLCLDWIVGFFDWL